MSWSSVVTTCVVVGSCLYIARENWMRRLWRIFMELLSLGTPSGARFAGALIFGLAWDVSESISGRERNSVDKSTIKYLIESVDVLSWVGEGGSWPGKPIGLRSTAYGGGGSLCWAQWRAREEEGKKKKERKECVGQNPVGKGGCIRGSSRRQKTPRGVTNRTATQLPVRARGASTEPGHLGISLEGGEGRRELAEEKEEGGGGCRASIVGCLSVGTCSP